MRTTHGWFDVKRFPNGITMIAEPGHFEDVKSYLVEGDTYVAVLDTGMGVADFAGLVASLTDLEPIVLQSHAHFDHIGASYRFDRVLIHPAEADDLAAGYPNDRFRALFEPEKLVGNLLPADFDPTDGFIPGCQPTGALNHGDRIDLGGRVLEVFYTPGHSPGGITLLDRANRALFPGDAIYAGPMYSYRPFSDPVRYRETLQLLARLADVVDVVYPSHNAVPLTPDDVRAMHRAYEEIWSGRPPDRREPEKDVFDFEGFSFWLRPGAYGPGAPITFTVAEARTRILDARRELLSYLDSLDTEALTQPRDAAGWSVKDHLAHLIRWERSIICLLNGRPRHEGLGVPEDLYARASATHDLDPLNAVMQAEDRDLSLEQVRAGFDKVHAETLATLEGLADADLHRSYASYLGKDASEETGQPIVFWIMGNTAFHYGEHLAWMQQIAGFPRP